MGQPLIAIIGGIDKTRNQQAAREAAEELGGELAKRGCRILVYGSEPDFLETYVVKGYLGSGAKIATGAIEVRYPENITGLFDGEKAGDERFIRIPLGSQWETTFYPSLGAADGMLLMGGGYTTNISGLIGAGFRMPIVALSVFGGSAGNVRDHLLQERQHPAAPDDLNLMGRPWNSESATNCVESLLNQKKRRELEAQAKQAQASEVERKRKLALLAILGSVAFLAVLIGLAAAWPDDKVSRTFLWMLFGIPAVAGLSGALIRVVYDSTRQNEAPVEILPATSTIALGFWAGGVAGALFVAAQIVALNALDKGQATRLFPFAVLIGLLTGLTLDKVFPRLIKAEVPLQTGILDESQKPITGKAARGKSA